MKPDLLFLAHRIPYPPNKGDKLRSYNLLRFLCGKYRVHLGCFVDERSDWEHVSALKALCCETYFGSLNPVYGKVRSLTSLLRGEALSVGYYRDRAFARWVNAITARNAVRHALAFSSVMAQYLVEFGSVRRVVDMVDVDSAKWGQYAAEKPWPFSWLYARESRKLLDFEVSVARAFDATVFVSEPEADLFRQLSGNIEVRVHSAANGVDSEYFSPEFAPRPGSSTDARTLVFTGAMDYWPNVDAVQWFAHEIFPAIQACYPDARFLVVGARPTPAVLKLGSLPGVEVTGTVPDVRPYIANARAVVAPLRIARGLQNKVLEGMSMGRTVIASPDAALGIDAKPGRDLVVAREPADYVAAVAAVFGGACDLGRNARVRVQEAYSWERNLGKIHDLLIGKPTMASAGACAGPMAAATV